MYPSSILTITRGSHMLDFFTFLFLPRRPSLSLPLSLSFAWGTDTLSVPSAMRSPMAHTQACAGGGGKVEQI